jgi:hypothetical protein
MPIVLPAQVALNLPAEISNLQIRNQSAIRNPQSAIGDRYV